MATAYKYEDLWRTYSYKVAQRHIGFDLIA